MGGWCAVRKAWTPPRWAPPMLMMMSEFPDRPWIRLDLSQSSHRELIDPCDDRLRFIVNFYSPRYSAWSVGSNRALPEKREANRRSDTPALSWTDNQVQAATRQDPVTASLVEK